MNYSNESFDLMFPIGLATSATSSHPIHSSSFYHLCDELKCVCFSLKMCHMRSNATELVSKHRIPKSIRMTRSGEQARDQRDTPFHWNE